MASKESKRPCGEARAGAAGGGGRARPWHAPAKGANWRVERGAGPGARQGARLEGPTRDGRSVDAFGHFRSGPRGRWVGPRPLLPPSPPFFPIGHAPSCAPGPSGGGPQRRKAGTAPLPRARASIASGSRPLSGGFWKPPAGLWLPTRASQEPRPLRVGDGESGPLGVCCTWIHLRGWVVEPVCLRVVIFEQVRTAVNRKKYLGIREIDRFCRFQALLSSVQNSSLRGFPVLGAFAKGSCLGPNWR